MGNVLACLTLLVAYGGTAPGYTGRALTTENSATSAEETAGGGAA